MAQGSGGNGWDAFDWTTWGTGGGRDGEDPTVPAANGHQPLEEDEPAAPPEGRWVRAGGLLQWEEGAEQGGEQTHVTRRSALALGR